MGQKNFRFRPEDEKNLKIYQEYHGLAEAEALRHALKFAVEHLPPKVQATEYPTYQMFRDVAAITGLILAFIPQSQLKKVGQQVIEEIAAEFRPMVIIYLIAQEDPAFLKWSDAHHFTYDSACTLLQAMNIDLSERATQEQEHPEITIFIGDLHEAFAYLLPRIETRKKEFKQNLWQSLGSRMPPLMRTRSDVQ